MTKFYILLLWLTTPIVLSGQLQREYRFNTPLHGKVVLRLHLAANDLAAVRFGDPTWFQHRKGSGTSDENYLLHVRGLFAASKPRMHPIYHVFDQALPAVPDRDFDALVVAFVQSIPYGLIPTRLHGENTHGIFPPLILLREGYGDCDSKSILLATLLTQRHPVLYLVGDSHVFIGLPGQPRTGEQYVEVEGQTWLLCETTDEWPIGRLPDKMVEAIDRGRYQYIILK